MIKKIWGYVDSIYFKYERHISSISIFGGFIFTIFTLTRVDEYIENIWVSIHLLVAGVGIILLNRFAPEDRRGEIDENANDKAENSMHHDLHFWLTFIVQFAFGGLFSTFLVFYFRSATLSVAWPFMLMLVAIFIANERLRKHYARLAFQISVLFLAIYTFLIYLIPVLLHQIGPWIFVLSGLASLVVISGFIVILRKVTKEKFKKSRKYLLMSIGGIFLVMNLLYFTDIIPPIPLSLKDAGIYHDITSQNGVYTLTDENKSWTNFFHIYDPVNIVSGDSLYAWSAVFSPTDLNTDIIHEWQHFDGTTGRWETLDTINLGIVGGRDGGFRTYSEVNNLVPGLWRVNVKTSNGQLIGRIKFNVYINTQEPALVNITQ